MPVIRIRMLIGVALCVALFWACSNTSNNTCTPTCEAGQTCDNGTCKANTSTCTPACEAGKTCVNGTCAATKQECSPACSAEETCINGSCVKSTACTSDANCSGATPKCNTTTGKCEAASTSNGGVGQACSKSSPCAREQTPPLYCSATSNTCKEATLVSDVGGACNKQNDTSEPYKVCDANATLYCNQETGTCKQAQTAAEGKECDPTGVHNEGTGILCQSGLICLNYEAGTSLQRCHKPCTGNSDCTTQGTTCEPLLQGGKGVCLDVDCSSDEECAYSNFACRDFTDGKKLCMPKLASGPIAFGGLCKTPAAKYGCNTNPLGGGNASAFCLKTRTDSTLGFCSQVCDSDRDCPTAKDDRGSDVSSTCVAASATQQMCLFRCGQPGKDCPVGLKCTDIGGSKFCAAP